MIPVKFLQQNCTFAENQPDYFPLPAWHDDERVITCWKLNMWDRLKVLFCGVVWIHQLNFGRALQPILPTTDFPFKCDTGWKEPDEECQLSS